MIKIIKLERSFLIEGTLTIIQAQSNLVGEVDNLHGQLHFPYNLSLLSVKTRKVIGYIPEIRYAEYKTKVSIKAVTYGREGVAEFIFEDQIKFYIQWQSDLNRGFDRGILTIGNKIYENTILVQAIVDEYENNN